MSVIDAELWGDIYVYECGRLIQASPTHAVPSTCEKAYRSETLRALLSKITVHLQRIAHNMQVYPGYRVVGYWALDDWPYDLDPGGAAPLLESVHQLVQRYTPGIPMICGFGGAMGNRPAVDWWNPAIGMNFTPRGCDMVGVYNAVMLTPASAIPASSSYDWTMSGLLQSEFQTLRSRGWDIAKQPLVGVVQTYGGINQWDTNYRWETPTAGEVRQMALGYCRAGATHISFYAWSMLQIGADGATPRNSPALNLGVRKGIAACQSYWNGRADVRSRHIKGGDDVVSDVFKVLLR